MPRPDPENVERVAVLGAGTIGASWTALFLAEGSRGARSTTRRRTPRRGCAPSSSGPGPRSSGWGSSPDADPTRFTIHKDAAAAVEGAAFVQENGPEDLAAKRALFARARASAGARTRWSPRAPPA